MTARLRVGTRGSRLALVQAERVADRLRALGFGVELVRIVTAGDRKRPGFSAQEGWFTQAIRDALDEGEVDLAVHSAKDLPVEAAPGSRFAYPERADPRDALLTRGRFGLAGLPAGSTVGTDSPRRAGFLMRHRPDLHTRPLPGNVPTRVEKLDRGEVDAIVLAVAGLQRLQLEGRIDQVLEPEVMVPAPAQGALALEVRAGDPIAEEAAAALDDPRVRVAVETERALLRAMGGGCRSPLGALAETRGAELRLLAGVPGRLVRRSGLWQNPDALVDRVRNELMRKENVR